MRLGIGVFGRKALQAYVVLLLVLLGYFHYCRRRASNSAAVIVRDKSVSKSPARDLFSQAAYYRAAYRSPIKHHHSNIVAPAGSQRFIFSLNYWEQLTMATVNLLSLVCLGRKWNATTVQPYTFNSRLYGLQNFKPGSSACINGRLCCQQNWLSVFLQNIIIQLSHVVGDGRPDILMGRI